MASSREENFISDPSAFTALTQIHKLPISECCFSPDSDQILTGSEDKTVVLWNLPPKDTELHDETINDEHKLVCYRLSDHKSPVTSVAIHRKLFLSASKDGFVKLWKLIPESSSTHSLRSTERESISNFKKPSPEPITYNCHTKIIRSLTFSRTARCFATGSDDKSVKIWSTECRNKTLASLLGGHTNWIKCVRWSKTSDHLLASCGDDGVVCIWDTRTKVRQPPAQVLSHRRRVAFNCLDWHPVFENHIATGAQDASCGVWDRRNLKQVQLYAEHTESVNSLAFNSGGSLLLTGSSDKTSKIFDVCEGRNMFTLKSHKETVTSVCFDRTGEMFATASKDNTVTVWKRNFDTVNIVVDDEVSELDLADDNDLTIDEEPLSNDFEKYERRRPDYQSQYRHHRHNH